MKKITVRNLVDFLDSRGFFNKLSDKTYLKTMYKIKVHKHLDLDNPKTFNEKLQWLKLHVRDPKYTACVDKYEVKKIVADELGEELIIPTIGIWNSFDEIDFDSLPEQFVLKCTHDSGGLVICKNKSDLNIPQAKKKIEKSLKRNYYYMGREWPYKNVKPRILAEQYMVDESNYELKDYKFFVFNGEVKALFIATDRTAETETCFDFYDKDFNHLPIRNGHPNAERKINKPDNFEKMIDLAEKLGKGFPHVRIDFYNIRGKVYFGEMTFFHNSGIVSFDPE